MIPLIQDKMKKLILFALLILSLAIGSCYNQKEAQTAEKQVDESIAIQTPEMNSFVAIFEIPATDISRAIEFYKAILDITIETYDMGPFQMGVFPYENQMVTGVIMQGEGYQPSANGITIYLNAGDNLQLILDKVEKNGGQIIVPKTEHGDGSGYFAIFLDSEGNKMGLHSLN
jgi:predicted enzyme related to lactoylglutathione lyase